MKNESELIPKKKATAINIFEKNNGILRVSDAVKQGIPQHLVYSMLEEGTIIKIDRGLYQLANRPPLAFLECNPKVEYVYLGINPVR